MEAFIKENRGSDGTFVEENIVLNIFPLEIWLQVFQYVQQKSMYGIYTCIPGFTNILLPCRTKFMSCNVLESVLYYMCRKYKLSYKKTSQLLLHWRAICRSWRNSVDIILQDDYTLSRGPRFAYWIKTGIRYKGIRYRFQDLFDSTFPNNWTSLFKSHFHSSHLSVNRNPFVSRALELTFYCSPPAHLDYKPELDELLSKVGQHIWYCSLHVTDYATTGYYSEYRRVFELLPNLKTININHECWQSLDDIKERGAIQPFQNLPKLQCVRLYGQNTVILLRSVLMQNLHIKVLQMNDFHIGNNSILFNESMPNLQELEISVANICDICQLDKPPAASWPLKKLNLNLKPIERAVHWRKVGELFQILEKNFGRSLQELQLSLPPRMYSSPKPYSLDLPYLKTLTLRMPYAQSVDYILPMKNKLECLTIKFSFLGFVLNTQDDTLQLFDHAENGTLQYSNTWSVFFKLKQLNWRGQIFKRAGSNGILLKQRPY